MIKTLLAKKRKLSLLIVGMAVGQALHAQVTVSSTLGVGTMTYATLNAAFADINNATHQGDVDIAITGNTTEPAPPVPLASSGTNVSSYTSVRIHPVGGNWTINSASSPSGNRGIIELWGADNVTIDGDDPLTPGSRNLTIQAATSGSSGIACIRLASRGNTGVDGANNDTVKNCILIGPRNSATTTASSYCINMSDSVSITTGAYGSLNTVIENNEMRRAGVGVYANGGSPAFLNTGTIIRSNIIGSAIAADNMGLGGIYIINSSVSPTTPPAIIENNDIRVGAVAANGTGYGTNVYGIYVGDQNPGCLVQNNNIHDIMNPYVGTFSGGAYGIMISSSTINYSTGAKILNNFIRDVVSGKNGTSASSTWTNYGIYINGSTTGLIINHNTIALLQPNMNGTVANAGSACITMTNSGARIAEFQNNILINKNNSTNAIGLYTSSTANITSTMMDNNDYYVPNGAIGYYNGGQRQTLSNWQLATAKDALSLNVNPDFVSATDLHISSTVPSALESAGATTATVLDIDGDARPGPAGSANGGGMAPDIGADEFDGILPSANDMEATAFFAPTSGSLVVAPNSITPQATFTNKGTATQSGVQVRYQIFDGSNNLVYNNTAFTTTLVPYSAETVAFTSFAVAAGTYTIKAIAELAGDAFHANDTITGSFTAVAPLCGSYHIGAAQPAPFNTVSNAVNALNTAGVSCAVQFLLDDGSYSESGAIVFNSSIPGVSATNTVTIRPNTGTNVALTGTTAQPFIKIQSPYIIIDGSNTSGGTTRNLTVTNKFTSSCFHIGSNGTTPITDVTIKNCNLVDSILYYGITICNAASLSTVGYFNNITIANNDFKSAQYGIYANAALVAGNGSGLLITGNTMNSPMPDAIRRMGMRIEGVDGVTITNNEIGNMEDVTGEQKRAIYAGTGTTNVTIKGNTISNLGYSPSNNSGGVQAIAVVSGTGALGNATNILIDSNFISNITSATTVTGFQNQIAALSLFGTIGGATVTRNKIDNIVSSNTTGYGSCGINLQSSVDLANIIVANNFVSNISSQGSATFENNAHGIFLGDGSGYKLYHNSVNMGTGGQSGTEISSAITIGTAVTTAGGAGNDIRNNIFANGNTNGAVYAIYSQVATGNNASVYTNLDYNDYYSGGTNVAYFSGADQSNVAALQTSFAGANANSVSILPVFVSTSDLHLQGTGSTNAGIIDGGTATVVGGITTDIDGTARPYGTATDMGAHEYGAPTAIELAGIKAVNAGMRNRIDWQSADEKKADRYIVERSTDGRVFDRIGVMNAKGAAAIYTYWDEVPVKGINYYRLKMYEKNGEFTYSKTVSAVLADRNTKLVSVYPNPVAEGQLLTVEVNGTIASGAHISITDITGKVIYQQPVKGNKTTIDVSALASGIYLLNYYSDGHNTEIVKINKK